MTKYYEREISKDIYERAMKHNGYVAKEDKDSVWDMAELHGYGVYDSRVSQRDGKYYVTFTMGSSCD